VNFGTFGSSGGGPESRWRLLRKLLIGSVRHTTNCLPPQRKVIERFLQAKTLLGGLPDAGTGKQSVLPTAQPTPAGGCTVVVSLISLMIDQSISLRQKGIAAVRMRPKCFAGKFRDGWHDPAWWRQKIVRTSAPRAVFQMNGSRPLGAVEISLLAIDEAHLHDQWGHFVPAG